MLYEVWSEGYAATGERAPAIYLGKYEADSFLEACMKAMKAKGWSLSSYNPVSNTYWGCRFFDNEIKARKSFG